MIRVWNVDQTNKERRAAGKEKPRQEGYMCTESLMWDRANDAKLWEINPETRGEMCERPQGGTAGRRGKLFEAKSEISCLTYYMLFRLLWWKMFQHGKWGDLHDEPLSSHHHVQWLSPFGHSLLLWLSFFIFGWNGLKQIPDIMTCLSLNISVCAL